MIDRSLIGEKEEPRSIEVERGPLSFFARVTGASASVHHDVGAARAAGHRDLIAPPSYVFTLSSFSETGAPWVERLGVDLAKILHAEQRFEHFLPICAGDVVSFQSWISDIYEKKNGALEFVERETVAFVADKMAARMITVLVVRHV